MPDDRTTAPREPGIAVGQPAVPTGVTDPREPATAVGAPAVPAGVTDPREPATAATAADPREILALRTRVADLEAQLAEQSRRTAGIVAEAQEKLYWLERWQVDLDAVMRRPGAVPALETLKGARSVLRRSKKLKRRLLGSG